MSSTANFRLYGAVSTVLAAAVVGHSYHTRHQFYAICVHLVTSKASMMVLGNMAFFLFLIFGKMFKNIFLGTLRDVEVEHLTDKTWTTMMDTLLIMTIFRDEFTAKFISLFVFLLFMKTFHWLSQDRVDYLQQTPQVSGLTRARILTLMLFLLIVDVGFVYYSVTVALAVHGPSMMILFGFEYLLLVSSIVCTTIKYFLNVVDMAREGRWEAKGAYVLYLEFATDVFRLIVYTAFFSIILTFYGIPLHIIRQLYYTFTSFQRRVAEVRRYRKATTNMHTRFPNATPQELAQAETCIVCREEMTEGKKLPCDHILHLHCLRSWLERQQICPICRTPVLQEELPQRQNVQQQIPPLGNWNAQFINQQGWNAPQGANNMPGAENQFQQHRHQHAEQPNGVAPNNMQVDLLQQVEMLQQQLLLMNQQLQFVHAYLSMQGGQQFVPAQVPVPIPAPASEEDEELRKALELSQQQVSSTTSQTETVGERETEKEKEKETDSPGDEIRRRRLLRFSQN